MSRKDIYHLTKYPNQPTEGGFLRCIDNLLKNAEKLSTYIHVYEDQYNYTVQASTIPYNQDKRANSIAKLVGNFTRTKFLMNWGIKQDEVFMYYVIIGKGDNPYIANRLFHQLYLTILYRVDYKKGQFVKKKRKLRRSLAEEVEMEHARSYASNIYLTSIKFLRKNLKSILIPLNPLYTEKEEWQIIRYIDERFKLKIKGRTGPNTYAEPTLKQYHGNEVHQINNKWPIY
tara:strand:+ start:22998 stop:23687 length:690 start_codon:yes stop_codon:yes gene_type:complete